MLSKTQAKYIQSLVHKKFREQYGQYIIEGPKLLSEAISANLTGISKIYAYPGWIENMPQVLHQKHIEVIPVSEDEMKKISSLSTPGPVLAIMQMPAAPVVTSFPGITLLLDAIQDPATWGQLSARQTGSVFGISFVERVVQIVIIKRLYSPPWEAYSGQISFMRIFHLSWIGSLVFR